MTISYKFLGKEAIILISKEPVKKKETLVLTQESRKFSILKPSETHLGKDNWIILTLVIGLIVLKKNPRIFPVPPVEQTGTREIYSPINTANLDIETGPLFSQHVGIDKIAMTVILIASMALIYLPTRWIYLRGRLVVNLLSEQGKKLVYVKRGLDLLSTIINPGPSVKRIVEHQYESLNSEINELRLGTELAIYMDKAEEIGLYVTATFNGSLLLVANELVVNLTRLEEVKNVIATRWSEHKRMIVLEPENVTFFKTEQKNGVFALDTSPKNRTLTNVIMSILQKDLQKSINASLEILEKPKLILLSQVLSTNKTEMLVRGTIAFSLYQPLFNKLTSSIFEVPSNPVERALWEIQHRIPLGFVRRERIIFSWVGLKTNILSHLRPGWVKNIVQRVLDKIPSNVWEFCTLIILWFVLQRYTKALMVYLSAQVSLLDGKMRVQTFSKTETGIRAADIIRAAKGNLTAIKELPEGFTRVSGKK